MSKRILEVSLPEREGEYSIVLDKLSKFLFNDGNTLYFEYPQRKIDIEAETPPASSDFTQIKVSIIQFNGDNTYIPDGYSYLCSFEDNAHIRYFVYLYDSLSGLLKNFSDIFGGIL